jgi:hypothetical protein
MNTVDFTQLGGYRLKQSTFKRLQDNFLELLAAFITHIEIPPDGKFIVGGCYVEAGGITPGYLYIDGHLCFFPGIAGNTNPLIAKVETTQSITYKNGATLPVIKLYTTTTGSGTAYNQFERKSFTLPNNIYYLRKGEVIVNLGIGAPEGITEIVTFEELEEEYQVIISIESNDGVFVSPISHIVVNPTSTQFTLKMIRFGEGGSGSIKIKWKLINN